MNILLQDLLGMKFAARFGRSKTNPPHPLLSVIARAGQPRWAPRASEALVLEFPQGVSGFDWPRLQMGKEKRRWHCTPDAA